MSYWIPTFLERHWQSGLVVGVLTVSRRVAGKGRGGGLDVREVPTAVVVARLGYLKSNQLARPSHRRS